MRVVPEPLYHRGYPYLPDFWEYYRWQSEVYDRFAISTDAAIDFLDSVIPLAGLRVLDVASGTGRSACAMAAHGGRSSASNRTP